MNEHRRRLADELYATSHEHDQAQPDRLDRFRNVEPQTAELLGVLIRATRARRILELGTSNGYSTIWLADAAQDTGGSVVSVDVDARRTELARANLRSAGLEDGVELRTEDAAHTLASSKDSEWEFVFLDAERPAYPGYLAGAHPDAGTGRPARRRQRPLARARVGRVHSPDRARAHADADGRPSWRRAQARGARPPAVDLADAGESPRSAYLRRRSPRARRFVRRRSLGFTRRPSASARRKNVASSRSPILSAWMT